MGAPSAKKSSRAGRLLASPPTKPAPTPKSMPPSRPLDSARGKRKGGASKANEEQPAEEEEEEEEEEEDERKLESVTAAELHQLCKEAGIQKRGNVKKADLIAALREAGVGAGGVEEEEEEEEEEDEGDEVGGEDDGDEDEKVVEEEEEEEESRPLLSFTMAELHNLCEEAGIPQEKGSVKKAAIIAALREAGFEEEEKEVEEGGDDEEEQEGEQEEDEEDEEDEEVDEDEKVTMPAPRATPAKAKAKANVSARAIESSDDDSDGEGAGQRPVVSEKAAIAAIASCSLFGGGNDDDEEDEGGGKEERRRPAGGLEKIIRTSVGEALLKRGPKGVRVLSSGLDGVAKISALRDGHVLTPAESQALKDEADKHMAKSTLKTITSSKLTLERPGLKAPKKTAVELKSQKWFGMRSTELDHNAKYTLALLANRDAIDPKRHYRKESRKPGKVPSLFQIGTVLNSATDYYSSRLTRKEKKPNLAQEVLSDDRLRPYIKGKFDALQAESEKNGKNALFKKGKRKAPWKQGGAAGGKGGKGGKGGGGKKRKTS